MEELLDIYTEDDHWVGQATRREVHQKGYWHQTFQCWILHRAPQGDFLLLQLRHPSKDTHPNQFDVSCAGHLLAGETVREGVRELEEELGLVVDFEDLHPLGRYKVSDETIEGILDHEFCHLFLYESDSLSLEDYSPQLEEVSGLFLVDVKAFKQLVDERISSVVVKGFTNDREGSKVPCERPITLSDLVKNDLGYYQLLFNSAG